MRPRCPLLALLCVLASLLVPGIASAHSAPGAENRVWAFDLAEQVHVGRPAPLTLELHSGCELAEYDSASGSLLAARGGGKWSRTPKSLQDQMTLDAAKQGAGRNIIDNLGDPKFKGMEKWEYKVKSANGRDSVVHYVRDPSTGKLMDFKFTKHSQ